MGLAFASAPATPRVELAWAVAISMLLHLSLLVWDWRGVDSKPRLIAPNEMEVVLVNARTDDAPLHAQVLAQNNVNGGGLAEQQLAATPLAPSPVARSGDALQEAQEQLAALQSRQTLLLSELKRQLKVLDAQALEHTKDSELRSAQLAKRQAQAQLIAQIEHRIEMQSARPKRVFAQVAAQQSAAALYFDHMRQVLEAQGTRNFPSSGGLRLYGELVMRITVDRAGRVLETLIQQGSGVADLDAHALQLTQAQNFGSFDAELRKQADQLVVISTFRFLKDDRLVMESKRAQP